MNKQIRHMMKIQQMSANKINIKIIWEAHVV